MSKQPKGPFLENRKGFIEEAIFRYTQESLANQRKLDGRKYWGKPLVGYASGNDPLFLQYKKIIGRFHFTPQEIFELTFGRSKETSNLTVISWILPMAEDIRKSNRKETRYPSILWAHARDFGEEFNVQLRNHVVAFLQKKGFRSVAPWNSPFFRWVRSPKIGLASVWSERHAAYACGLGTFGLSGGFITKKGKSIRIGSVITDLPIEPSPQDYPHHMANCLYFLGKSCLACTNRCPAGAISAKGHDKDKCYKYYFRTINPLKQPEYGVRVTGCGLCQTNVPCEFEIPRPIQKYRAT